MRLTASFRHPRLAALPPQPPPTRSRPCASSGPSWQCWRDLVSPVRPRPGPLQSRRYAVKGADRRAYLSLLGAPAWLQGAVISTQPVLELLLIPAMGVLADKFGATRLLIVGACAGVLGHTLFALGQHIAVLFAGQVLVSLLVASILGLGMTVAQDLYPSGVGYASSVFFGGLSLSAALGGLLGGIGASQLGMPLVFLIPALVSGFVGFGFYFIRAKQPVRLSKTYDNAVDSG